MGLQARYGAASSSRRAPHRVPSIPDRHRVRRRRDGRSLLDCHGVGGGTHAAAGRQPRPASGPGRAVARAADRGGPRGRPRQGRGTRDLKPENVMVTAEGRAKILDFGPARLAAEDAPQQLTSRLETMEAPPDATRAGTILGTVGYMSPGAGRRPAGGLPLRPVEGERALQPEPRPTSLAAQGHAGIHPRRAAGGQAARQQRHDGEEDRTGRRT